MATLRKFALENWLFNYDSYALISEDEEFRYLKKIHESIDIFICTCFKQEWKERKKLNSYYQ